MINGAADAAKSLAKTSSASDIRGVLAKLSFADPLEIEQILQIIRQQTGQPIAVLRKTQVQLAHSEIADAIIRPAWLRSIRLDKEGNPIPDAANILVPLRE